MMSSQEVSVSSLTSSFKGRGVAYCDVGHAPLLATSETAFQHDTLNSGAKEYDIKLKPLLSAFHLRPFALRSMRCFLMFYLPLLQSNIEECANVSLHDLVDEHQDVDYLVLCVFLSIELAVRIFYSVTSFCLKEFMKISGGLLLLLLGVLERLAVHICLPRRAAWKLIKDVPMSAMRKANKGMPFYIYFVRVSRTTFRGQFLGYAASWIVQVGIECYRFVRDISKSNEVDDVTVDPQHKNEDRRISATLLRHRLVSQLVEPYHSDVMVHEARRLKFKLASFNVTRVAYCDAVATTSLLRDASENVFRQDTKEYDIELKPMLSAFQLRPFALISIRSL
ncbi:hypothetical protein Tco_1007228 [Tanacetum coccineum]